MKYFNNCKTLEELKKEYRRLAFIHHPDQGGNVETMKAINNAYDIRFQELKRQHNATADEYHQTTESSQEFREIIEKLMRMDGVTVEICGCWIWCDGDTRKWKEELKAMKFRWCSKKMRWAWHHEEAGQKRRRGNMSMDEIRAKYGSQVFNNSGNNRIGAAC